MQDFGFFFFPRNKPFRLYTLGICSELEYFSDNFLKLAYRSLHIWLRFIWKRSSCFGVPFLPLIRIFLSTLICVNWFLLILPRSLFMPIVLRSCFRIFVLSVFYLFVYIILLYQFTNLKFPHLPFECQNPSSWQMSLSPVFLLDVTKYNHEYLFLWICTIVFWLFTIFISSPWSCKFLRYYVSNSKGLAMIFAGQENPFFIFRSMEIYTYFKTNNKIPINLLK